MRVAALFLTGLEFGWIRAADAPDKDVMDIFLSSFEYSFFLTLRMGLIMFVSLFGIELFMQMGLMKYLRPIGVPIARLGHLPSESAVSFLTAIGSMIAAHTMTAQFHADGKMSDRDLILTGVANTVPFHFRQILTFQLPIVLPLLGFRLCLIYISAFVLAGLIKLAFVILWGRLRVREKDGDGDAFDSISCKPDDPDCQPRSLGRLAKNSWEARKKMFLRMITLLGTVTLAVQILMNTGMLKWFETLILPAASLFDLPAAVVGPVSAYIFSPTVGIAYMSNLLSAEVVSPHQAIFSLLAGGLLMIPLTRLRRTLPRYISIFGFKHGMAICGLTTLFSMLSRVLILGWLLVFPPV